MELMEQEGDISLNTLSRGRIPDTFEIEETTLSTSPPNIDAVPSIECGSGRHMAPSSGHQGGFRASAIEPLMTRSMTATTSAIVPNDVGTTVGEPQTGIAPKPPPRPVSAIVTTSSERRRPEIPPPLPPRKYKTRAKQRATLSLCMGEGLTGPGAVSNDIEAVQTALGLTELHVPGGFPPRENQASFDSMEAFAGSQENLSFVSHPGRTSAGSESGASMTIPEASSQEIIAESNSIGLQDDIGASSRPDNNSEQPQTEQFHVTVTTTADSVTVTTLSAQLARIPSIESAVSVEDSPTDISAGFSTALEEEDDHDNDPSRAHSTSSQSASAQIVVTTTAVQQPSSTHSEAVADSCVNSGLSPEGATSDITTSGTTSESEPFSQSHNIDPSVCDSVSSRLAQIETVVNPTSSSGEQGGERPRAWSESAGENISLSDRSPNDTQTVRSTEPPTRDLPPPPVARRRVHSNEDATRHSQAITQQEWHQQVPVRSETPPTPPPRPRAVPPPVPPREGSQLSRPHRDPSTPPTPPPRPAAMLASSVTSSPPVAMHQSITMEASPPVTDSIRTPPSFDRQAVQQALLNWHQQIQQQGQTHSSTDSPSLSREPSDIWQRRSQAGDQSSPQRSNPASRSGKTEETSYSSSLELTTVMCLCTNLSIK